MENEVICSQARDAHEFIRSHARRSNCTRDLPTVEHEYAQNMAALRMRVHARARSRWHISGYDVPGDGAATWHGECRDQFCFLSHVELAGRFAESTCRASGEIHWITASRS